MSMWSKEDIFSFLQVLKLLEITSRHHIKPATQAWFWLEAQTPNIKRFTCGRKDVSSSLGCFLGHLFSLLPHLHLTQWFIFSSLYPHWLRRIFFAFLYPKPLLTNGCNWSPTKPRQRTPRTEVVKEKKVIIDIG